jgi:hypothetical protein
MSIVPRTIALDRHELQPSALTFLSTTRLLPVPIRVTTRSIRPIYAAVPFRFRGEGYLRRYRVDAEAKSEARAVFFRAARAIERFVSP